MGNSLNTNDGDKRLEMDENGNFIYFYAFKRKQYWLVNFALIYIMLFQNIHVIFKFKNLFLLSCLDKFNLTALMLLGM